jgi:two-component system sensor histidine kinase KdpD
MFGGDAALHLVGEDGAIADSFYSRAESALPPIDLLAAEWVANHDQPAGAGSDTLPSATYLFAPLTGSQRTLGAVGVRTADRAPLDPEQRRLLATCASLVALALERDRSTLEASEAQVAADTERIRSSLLGSVSHDLRTPLAAIGGAAASLADGEVDRDSPAGGELLTSIVEESRRLERLVENLLDMTRLEAGAVTPNRQWHVLEELAGVVLARLKRELADCDVAVDIPPNFPLLHVDGMLWEQLLVNLLENAARHGAHRIEFSARAPVDDGGRSRVEIRVADDGPGLPPGSEERIFQKFQRGAAGSADGRRGVGLGLAICHAIASAHGGRIAARNRAAGGAEFIVSLSSERPPEVPTEGPAGDSRAPGE